MAAASLIHSVYETSKIIIKLVLHGKKERISSSSKIQAQRPLYKKVQTIDMRRGKKDGEEEECACGDKLVVSDDWDMWRAPGARLATNWQRRLKRRLMASLSVNRWDKSNINANCQLGNCSRGDPDGD